MAKSRLASGMHAKLPVSPLYIAWPVDRSGMASRLEKDRIEISRLQLAEFREKGTCKLYPTGVHFLSVYLTSQRKGLGPDC